MAGDVVGAVGEVAVQQGTAGDEAGVGRGPRDRAHAVGGRRVVPQLPDAGEGAVELHRLEGVAAVGVDYGLTHVVKEAVAVHGAQDLPQLVDVKSAAAPRAAQASQYSLSFSSFSSDGPG